MTMTGYDAWKTRSPYEDDGPEVWDAWFDCDACGAAFDAEGDVVEFTMQRDRRYGTWAEGTVKASCPTCGEDVLADFSGEPDWASIAADLADR